MKLSFSKQLETLKHWNNELYFTQTSKILLYLEWKVKRIGKNSNLSYVWKMPSQCTYNKKIIEKSITIILIEIVKGYMSQFKWQIELISNSLKQFMLKCFT